MLGWLVGGLRRAGAETSLHISFQTEPVGEDHPARTCLGTALQSCCDGPNTNTQPTFFLGREAEE